MQLWMWALLLDLQDYLDPVLQWIHRQWVSPLARQARCRLQNSVRHSCSWAEQEVWRTNYSRRSACWLRWVVVSKPDYRQKVQPKPAIEGRQPTRLVSYVPYCISSISNKSFDDGSTSLLRRQVMR